MRIPEELRPLPSTRRPALVNAVEHWLAINRFNNRLAALGDRFVVTMPATGPWVGLTHPEDIEKVFRADSSTLHFAEALRKLSPHELVLGPKALTSLDGDAHLIKRRTLLPLFHGEALKRYEPTIEAKAREMVADWPRGGPTTALPRAQHVTLEIIMAAVFGVTDPARLARLRAALRDLMAEGATARFLVQIALAASRQNGYQRPFPRIEQRKAAIDAIVREEISERNRRGDTDGRDILSRLLTVCDENGQPLSTREICDHMRTLMIAGHDTTAATIAWVIERIVHHPGVMSELEATVRAGDDAYLDAVIHETLRLRPVFPFTLRLTKAPLELDGLTVEPETIVMPHITLVHRRPDIYPDPQTFRPERFLGTRPGTYSWIPFGGGMRRCIGASLSLLEARVVIRTLIQELNVRAERASPESIGRRAVVIVPERGARVTTWAR